MILDRLFRPTGNDTLYHYCTPSAFQAICETRSVRFSDVFSMNDFMEMHWGYEVWQSVARKTISDLGKDFIDSVDSVLALANTKVLPLTACFSTQGDVLSQWRAYAADGCGFCIGFDAKHMTQLAARPLQVLYDRELQEQELERAIRVIHDVHKEADSNIDEFVDICASVACDLAAYKNPAFAEESEVRLLHIVVFEHDNNRVKLKTAGGTAFEKHVEPAALGFRMRGSLPVPHVDMSIVSPSGSHPIREVLMGPKNDAMPSAVSVFLETVGATGVRVKKSMASYR